MTFFPTHSLKTANVSTEVTEISKCPPSSVVHVTYKIRVTKRKCRPFTVPAEELMDEPFSTWVPRENTMGYYGAK